ncbi:ROK family transcriptional regulator [Falsirhodobacter sp. 20TX0035]|uniref:ROK family transcriptional regulator n=1 Tax=Falsirhodobacter sp. 20TX0035 TaxID=3022019 RepID=UPI00232FB9AA|nr:ROK family transcriptional regulator [Falsirhodobacter sp. 20TX0035]MDB6455101.1 ROK family transcriptional regulator [Falsirhodobacter sp. 20TX0035]
MTKATIKGSNQTGVRVHNERVVLSLIRRHGKLAKADIARLSGLSAQTASVLMRGLVAEGLVLAGDPRKGRVGQPSVPMSLNPRGAFSLGLKIGRRTSEMVLMDFTGGVLDRRAIFYPQPFRAEVLEFATGAARDLCNLLSAEERARIAGLGVAQPNDLWAWGADKDWRSDGITDDLARATGLPLFIANDVTAACGAEQAFGKDAPSDFVYFFVGAFVGGGIVMDGRLIPGRMDNAGALGSLPVADGKGGVRQLIDVSSIHLLERAAREAGVRHVDLWHESSVWTSLGPLLDAWIDRSAEGLARATLAAMAVYDFEAAVIDGSFTPEIRARLVAATAAALSRLDQRGLTPIRVVEGTVGRTAREVGSASLPFFARYFVDHRVLYSER